MKIIINTASTHKGGGVQVARSFIEECRNFSRHEYHIVLGSMLSTLIEKNAYPENFSFYPIEYRPATRVMSIRSHNRFFKQLEEKVKPDVVFTTSGPAYWSPNAPHLVGYNLPHYIYRDSPFFTQISFYKRLKWDLKGMILKRYFQRDADAYVVQTEDVNKRLRKWVNSEDVYTVSNTCSSHYDNPQKVRNKLPERKVGEFRFLTLSAWYAHKNLQIIPKVLDALPTSYKDRIRFVLTLPEEVFCNKLAAESKGQIINIGPVNPDEGPALYKECDALFLPTLLECFSASYAEAMKMGKPIITSDLSFAHSVCGKAALYADPLSSVDFAGKVMELTEDKSLLKKLVSEGSNQQRLFANARQRAEKYLEICKDLAYAAGK